MKACEKIAREVQTKINDASSSKIRVNLLKKEYDRYVVLADGNRSVAWNFLVDSRPGEKDDLAKLKPIIAKEKILESARKGI